MADDRDRLTRVTITLPAWVVEAVDRHIGRRGRSRYIAEAASQRLRRDAMGAALRSSEGVLADGDET